MSDDNEIERPDNSGDEHDEDDDALDLPGEFVVRVNRSTEEVVTTTALKVFGLAYLALLLTALTLRVFERRK